MKLFNFVITTPTSLRQANQKDTPYFTAWNPIMTSMREICRLCMCRDDSMMSIFDEDGIAAKITWVSQLKIFQGDPLPAQICKRCSLRLDSAYYFKEQCISIDRALREMVQHQCSSTLQEVKPPTGDPAAPDGNVEDHLQTEHFDPSFNSRHVKPEAPITGNSDMPPRYETNNDTLGVISQADPATEASSNRNTRISPVPVTQAKKGFPCPICDKTFRAKAGMKRHIPTHSKKKTDKRKKNFEELTRPADTDVNQAKIQVDATPNLYEEVDIKLEHIDVAAETTSDIRESSEATFQSPDFNGRGERSYRASDIIGPVEVTFQSPDFNGRGERSYGPPHIRGPETTFQSPVFNGRGERYCRPPDIRQPGEVTFQSSDFNGRGERFYRFSNRGPGVLSFQPSDLMGRGGGSYQPPDINRSQAGFPVGTFQSPDLNGRCYRPSDGGPVAVSYQSSDLMGRGGGSYRPPINGSRAGLPMGTFRSYDLNGPNGGPSTATYRPNDHNRPRPGFPTLTTQHSGFNGPNVVIPMGNLNFPSSGFVRPNVAIPIEGAQTSDFNQRTQTSNLNQRTQTSDFNQRTQTSNFNQRTQTSDFNQRIQTSDFNQRTQTSDFNQRTQTSDFNQRTQTSDFNRLNHRVPVITLSSGFNGPHVEVLTGNLRPSDLNRPNLDVSMENAQSTDAIATEQSTDAVLPTTGVPEDAVLPTTGPEDEVANARPAKKRRSQSKRGGARLVFECPFCDETFGSRSKAETHILSHLQSESDDGPPLRLDEFEPIALTPVATRGLDVFKCETCGKETRGRGALVNHVRTHTRDKKV